MKTCIFAGNPRVSIQPDGKILTETQPIAFREALARACKIRDESGDLPYIAVGFDHAGSFSVFTKDGLSQRRRNSPQNMCDLRADIAAHFTEAAQQFNIGLNNINIIREGAVLSKAKDRISAGEYPDKHAHCEVIATEFLRSTIHKSDADALIVFHENTSWSETFLFVAAKHRLSTIMESLQTTIYAYHPE